MPESAYKRPHLQVVRGQSTSQTRHEFLIEEEMTSSSTDIVAGVRQLQSLLGRLNEVFNEAKERDWDGDNAEPVSDSTYYNATKLLLVITGNLPAPEISADNDGFIEFEWYKEGRSFSLYITDTNLVLYAGFYGKEDRLSGRFNYEGFFPSRAERLAKDVYKQGAN